MSAIKSKNEKSSKAEMIRDWIDFIFGVRNKKGEILDHWIAFQESFSFPPQDFYTSIRNELEARKIPGMTISEEEFAEGGTLSSRRIYLRMFRERLALYICASPFGVGYFFSCRVVYVPALVRLWHILAAILLFGLAYALLVKPLGASLGMIAVVALLFALAAVFRNAASDAFSDLDTLLLNIPVISTFYEQFFRDDTYYRIDTRTVYVKTVPEIVRRLAEDITAEHGAKLVDQYECAPIFGDLYKKVPPRTDPAPS